MRWTTFGALLLAVAGGASARNGPQPADTAVTNPFSTDAVQAFLRRAYADYTIGIYSGSRLVEVDSPTLRKHLPGTRFYVTMLQTRFLNWPEVEMIVSASAEASGVKYRTYHSPAYINVSEEFLTQFRGLRAEGDKERRRLTREIGELFRRISFRGNLSNARADGDRYRFDLSFSGYLYRRIVFRFDKDGRLASVALCNPSSEPAD
jgi:hypothetical protein